MRLLAVRQDNNGDVTLIGPAVRALARAGTVTLVCAPSGEGAARLLPGVANVIVARAEWIAGEPRPLDRAATAAYVAAVAAADIDHAVIFTSWHQSPLPAALLLRLAGVRYVHAVSVDYPGSLLDTRAAVPDDLHEVERALRLVAAAGFRPEPDDDARLRYRPLPEIGTLVPAHFVALQPGATVPARAWAPERYRELVRLLDDRGVTPVVLGSAGERELGAFIAAGTHAVDLCGRTDFAEFAAVVASADALVVGNSAGIHVAGAVGTPVVTVFPPTIPPQRFLPWKVPNVVLGRHDIACAGCRARCCPIPGHPCIDGVDAEAALAALERLGALPAAAALR